MKSLKKNTMIITRSLNTAETPRLLLPLLSFLGDVFRKIIRDTIDHQETVALARKLPLRQLLRVRTNLMLRHQRFHTATLLTLFVPWPEAMPPPLPFPNEPRLTTARSLPSRTIPCFTRYTIPPLHQLTAVRLLRTPTLPSSRMALLLRRQPLLIYLRRQRSKKRSVQSKPLSRPIPQRHQF